MTTSSASVTNRKVLLPQSRNSTTMYQERNVHLCPLTCRCHTDDLYGWQHIIWTVHAQDSMTIAWSMKDLNPNIPADGRVSFYSLLLHALILSLVFHTLLVLNSSHKQYTLKNVSIYLFPKFNFVLKSMGKENQTRLSRTG